VSLVQDDICHHCRETIDITQSLVLYHGRIDKTYCTPCFEAICARWIKIFRIVRRTTPQFPGTVRYRPSHEVLLPERVVA
jgi:hypothetical protein